MQLWMATALGLLALLGLGRPGRALAQESAPAPSGPAESGPPDAAPVAVACFPACRDGFTCHQGQCISQCNPACPAGLECVEGRRCEPPLPQSSRARPYEPPPPPVKGFEERSHTLLGFHLGLPGNVTTEDGQADGAASRERPLDTTLGFNLRADAPLAKYVLLGPMLQFGSWRPDTTPESDHNYYVDLDLVLRLRAPITTSSLNYQLWLGMPVGITFDVVGSDSANTNLGLGWNIGALFGGAVHFSPKFGLFGEVGWQQHRISHSRDPEPDLDFKFQQACLNLGIVVRN
jgi:hypothetical protein